MTVHPFVVEHHFEQPVRAVWPLVCDTDLLNRCAGVPPVEFRDLKGEDGLTRRLCRQRVWPFRLEYIEQPFEWTYGRGWRVERHFSRGPFRRYSVEVAVTPDVEGDWDEAGCTVRWVLEFDSPSWIAPAIWAGARVRDIPNVARTYRAYEAALAAGREPTSIAEEPGVEAAPRQPRPAGAGERRRIAEGVARTRKVLETLAGGAAQSSRDGTLERLLDHLEDALVREDPSRLWRMRPVAYARRWGARRADVVELFLAATQAGLLVMRWDVICPHCRGDRANLVSLAEVEESAFCAACDVPFDVDLSRSLEAVFAPHPAVREPLAERYCLGGPGTNAHVYFQRVLPSGGILDAPLRLPAGRYRLRAAGRPVTRWVDLVEGAPVEPVEVEIGEDGPRGGDLRLAADRDVSVRVRNGSGGPVRVIVESAAWIRDALPAGELMATQRFRDLYTGEVLAPGVKLGVERLTILFTDVVGSTALYRRIGDARAFRLVWSHFDGLTEVVAAEGGAVVKTIGDAVMAVFTRAEDAVRAAARFQQAVDRHTRPLGLGEVPLKIGLADGPCIAVNLNGRLDYFGSTVNLAARVQGASRGGDVVLPRETAERARADALLAAGWAAEPLEIEAKGFERRVPVLRFVRRGPGG